MLRKKLMLRGFGASVLMLLSGCTILPNPFTPKEHLDNLANDIQALNTVRPILDGELTLNHAIARALKYNLDYRIKLAEQAIARSDMSISNLNMLPNLVAHAGYVDRSNVNEVLSPITGQVSTAEDRVRRLADLNFSWNVLDFGVSYFESKQKADQVLIAEQEKRKMIQRLSKDTKKAFWRAFAAARYTELSRGYEQDLKNAINNSATAEQDKLMSPVDAARFRRDLWLIYNQILQLNFEMARFKPELMGLISAPGHAKLKLKANGYEQTDLSNKLPDRLDKLEQLALYYRPELQEENYRNRIGLNEINKARLRMLPGFEFNYGSYYDSNSYLVHNQWNQLSLSLSWNIIKIMSNAKSYRLAKQQTFLAEVRRVALSMAIVTQVDIAKLSYTYAKDNLYTNAKILENELSIYQNLYKQKGNLTSQFALTKARGALVLAQLKRDMAYADFQTAASELSDSLGLDPVYQANCLDLPIDELTKVIDTVNAKPVFEQQQLEKILAEMPNIA